MLKLKLDKRERRKSLFEEQCRQVEEEDEEGLKSRLDEDGEKRGGIAMYVYSRSVGGGGGAGMGLVQTKTCKEGSKHRAGCHQR